MCLHFQAITFEAMTLEPSIEGRSSKSSDSLYIFGVYWKLSCQCGGEKRILGCGHFWNKEPKQDIFNHKLNMSQLNNGNRANFVDS
jgi:hypothetical protein